MDKYIVVKEYVTEFLNPIKLSEKQEVICIEESNVDGEWANWTLCKTQDNEGWVPSQIIKKHKNKGTITQDYYAIEFNLKEGEILVAEKILNGWIWAYKENEVKNKAWAPLNYLEKLK